MKKLNRENWLDPDPKNRIFYQFPPEVDIRPSADEWTEAFLAPHLDDAVPQDIKDMFEAAQAVICYGYFHYPLFKLGSDQLYRVLDAALGHKCRSVGAPKLECFQNRYEWLLKRGYIEYAMEQRWQSAVKLRNETSHANSPSLFPPGVALTGIRIACELINSVFRAASINLKYYKVLP